MSGAKAGDLLNRQTSVVRILKPKCERETLVDEENSFLKKKKLNVKIKIFHTIMELTNRRVLKIIQFSIKSSCVSLFGEKKFLRKVKRTQVDSND